MTHSLTNTASWVIIDKTTNKPIFETFSSSIVSKINTEKYTVVPILEHLQALNKNIKNS